MDYILKKDELAGLAAYFKTDESTLEEGWKNLQATKDEVKSKLDEDCQWIQYEQTQFIYDHQDRTFSQRGLCASMSLLMFQEYVDKAYPVTLEGLKVKMNGNAATLATYDKEFSDQYKTASEDKYLNSFVNFCSSKGVDAVEKYYDDIQKDPTERLDLDNIPEGATYFIGEKAQFDKEQPNGHVVFLYRKAENEWYLFDPTMGIFITPKKDTIKEILGIKTEARIKKVANDRDKSKVTGWTKYMSASFI